MVLLDISFHCYALSFLCVCKFHFIFILIPFISIIIILIIHTPSIPNLIKFERSSRAIQPRSGKFNTVNVSNRSIPLGAHASPGELEAQSGELNIWLRSEKPNHTACLAIHLQERIGNKEITTNKLQFQQRKGDRPCKRTKLNFSHTTAYFGVFCVK